MKSLYLILFVSFFSITSLASYFKVSIDRGYFKNGYSLSEAHNKTENTYLLSYLSNNEVRKITVVTKGTYELMKKDLIQIIEILKTSNQRKIASCLESLTIKTQEKEKSFCASQLTEVENKKLTDWLEKARFYTGLKK